MAFLKKAFQFFARGVTPSEATKRSGFQAGKPLPADYLNESLSANYEAITELQEKAAEKEDLVAMQADVTATKTVVENLFNSVSRSLIEQETMRRAENTKLNANVYAETFENLDDVTLVSGSHNVTDERLEVA